MKREYFLSFIAFFLVSINIFSQNLSTTDQPTRDPDKKEFGFFAGLGGNMQNGKFLTSCNCSFDNGLKLGFTIGALYEQELNKNLGFSVGAMLGYDNRSIKAVYSEYEKMALTSTSSGRTEDIPILFRNTASADFHNLIVIPYIKWTPFKYVFARLGFEAGINVSNHILYQKELLQSSARLSNGEIVSVNYEGTKSMVKTIDDSDFPEANRLLLSITPMIGGNIKISKKVTFSPVVYYSYPLNLYSSKGENFNVSAIRALLEVRILLNGRSDQ